tara:strand:+ start:78 stop:671 length:594 start_codon:yes stop_codon:yes gene_type:complete
MKQNASKRLFIAIDLPLNIVEYVSSIVQTIKLRGLNHIRWVKVENSHITLKLLGNTPEELVERVISDIKCSCIRIKPFKVQIQNLGVFPDINSPRVLWMGIGGDISPMLHIKNKLDELLQIHGFPTEKRSFSPHRTIGRISKLLSEEEVSGLARCITEIAQFPPAYIEVSSLDLVESHLTKAGSIYTTRHKQSLKAG